MVWVKTVRTTRLPVNLYLPRSAQGVNCIRSEKHVNQMLEEWFKIHDRISLWLQLDPVAIELGPEMLPSRQ